MVIRWPGHIKPGTVKNEMFASLDWVPTFVEIAGGPKGDGLKKQIEAGQYPGIVKTTLDGVNQIDYLDGKSDKSARDYFFYYSGKRRRRRCATRTGRCTSPWCRRLRRQAGSCRSSPIHWTLVVNIKRDPFETVGRLEQKTAHEPRRRARRPGDRLPVRLEHAADRPAAVAEGTADLRATFPPLQAPRATTSSRILEQVKKANASHASD